MVIGASSHRAGGTMNDDTIAQAHQNIFEEGARAFPALTFDATAFYAHLRDLTSKQEEPTKYLQSLHAADLYLAYACKERIPGAAEALQSRYEADLDAALRSRKIPKPERDELKQIIWEKLLVGRPGSPAKIGDYAGRGALGGWLRVAAIRSALNHLEQEQGELRRLVGPLDEARQPLGPDPELAFLQSHYRQEVERALKDALASLETDERNVLRLYVLDGLSIDRIAAVYGIHRATAARWVTRGREAILQKTRALLGQRLQINEAEVESILAVVRSQINLTLSTLFRDKSRDFRL